MRNLLLLLVIVFALPMSPHSVYAGERGYVDHIGAAVREIDARNASQMPRSNTGYTIIRPPSYSVDSKGNLDTTYRPPIIIQQNYGIQDPGNFGGTYRYNY